MLPVGMWLLLQATAGLRGLVWLWLAIKTVLQTCCGRWLLVKNRGLTTRVVDSICGAGVIKKSSGKQ